MNNVQEPRAKMYYGFQCLGQNIDIIKPQLYIGRYTVNQLNERNHALYFYIEKHPGKLILTPPITKAELRALLLSKILLLKLGTNRI